MVPISQTGNSPYFNRRSWIRQAAVYCTPWLFLVIRLPSGLSQQVDIEESVTIFTRTKTPEEAAKVRIAKNEGKQVPGNGLSPKLPRVPSVAEMTGKSGRAELLLQSSGTKINTLQSEKQPITEYVTVNESATPRDWGAHATTWAAPNFYSHPLYFEQVNLERYQTNLPPCAVPLVSYAHFLGSIPTLPYQAGYKHPADRSFTLGHWRPGDSVPHRIHWTPFTKRGLLYQGAASTGAVFLLP